MNILLEFVQNFWQVFTGIAPWLLTGFLVSGIIAWILPPDQVKRHLGGRGWKTVVKAVLLGVPLPICSCGVIPVATALRKEGADRGATGAFYISTPQTGVDSMLVTWSLIGLPMALLRVALAALSGLTGGWLINRFGGPDVTVQEEKKCCCCCGGDKKAPEAPAGGRPKLGFWGSIKFILGYGFVKMVKRTAPTLLFGIFAAALIQQIVPADFGAKYIGDNRILEFAIIILISLPLYVCSTASVPIAAALMLKGFSPGAALVFMIAGPAANSVSITSMKSLLGGRSTLLAMVSICFWTLLAGTLVNVFEIPFELLHPVDTCSHIGTGRIICGIILGVLLAKGYIEREVIDKIKLKKTDKPA